MRSYLSLSQCLAIGWLPLVWSLSQANASAAIAGAAVAPAHPLAPKIIPKAAQPSSAPLSVPFAKPAPVAATTEPSDRPAEPALVTDASTAPLLKASSPSLRSSLPFEQATDQASKPAKPPKSLLADFLPDSATATETPDPSAPIEVTAETERTDAALQLAQTSNPALEDLPRDPELGVIQVADPRIDPELGIIQLRNPLQDSELGILELRQISPPPPPRPFLFVSTYVTASSSDNVFLVEDPLQGRFGDNYIRPGISVTAFPTIGPNTNLLASVEANWLRYEEQSASSYDELRFRAGIRHRFAENVYGQLSFSSQLLFDEGFDNQFFTNNGIEWTVGRRDVLAPQLTLDSFYQGQVYFSDPSEFSNVLNSVGAYLGYRISSQWDTGVGYRLTISDFTRQSRHETYQRITGQLRYSITPSVRLSVFGGLSYGRSSEDRITFDDSFFGISFDATIQVF